MLNEMNQECVNQQMELKQKNGNTIELITLNLKQLHEMQLKLQKLKQLHEMQLLINAIRYVHALQGMRNNISEVYTSISELNDGRRSPTRKGGAFSKKLTLTQNLTLTLSNPTQPSPIRRGLTRLSVFGRGNIPPPNRRRWPQAGGGSRRGFRREIVE